MKTILRPEKLHRTVLLSVLALTAITGCQNGSRHAEYGYVAAVQVSLRDRVAPVFEKTGMVSNAERVEVLERSKNGRFVRVRSPRNEEGWMEQRYLASQGVFDLFQKISADNAGWPVQGQAATRASLNMHAEPGRESPALYQLKEGEKLELLKRATTEKPLVRGSEPVAAAAPPLGPVLEDWWLVRDSSQHAGWVLGRMVDLDAPIEVAQYAEGQRIVACFLLDHVDDAGKSVPQYLMLLNEPKDGNPVDFNQVRVFTWNLKRDRYETAYRERKLAGMLPVRTGFQEFDKEGKLPTFTLMVKASTGEVQPVTYKLNGAMVHKVLSKEEVAKTPVKASAPNKTRAASLPAARE